MNVLDDIIGVKPPTPAVMPSSASPSVVAQNHSVVSQPVETPPPPKVQSYTDLFKAMNPTPQLTEEEYKKVKKRENARSILSAVGDGISALSNLYSTTKGAVNVEQKAPLSTVNNHRYTRYRERLEKLEDEKRRGALDAGYKDIARAYQEKRDKVADDRWLTEFNDRNEKWNKNYQHSLDEAKRNQGNIDRSYTEGVRQFGERMKQGDTQFWAGYGLQKGNLDLRKAELIQRGESNDTKNTKDKTVSLVVPGEGGVNFSKDVFESVYPMIYDKILGNEELKKLEPGGTEGPTTEQMRTFVLQHWWKDPDVKNAVIYSSQQNIPVLKNNSNNSNGGTNLSGGMY